jgi:hypothetical protein
MKLNRGLNLKTKSFNFRLTTVDSRVYRHIDQLIERGIA